MSPETTDALIQVCYLVASVLFIMGLRGLGNAATARRGVQLAEIGMLLAVVGTLMRHEIITYTWIIVGLVIGSLIGTVMAISIPMTKMPERIALSHAFGGLAVALVGVSEYWHRQQAGELMNNLQISATGFEVLLGALTFTGSLMAFGKLQGLLPGAPMTFPGQNLLNALFLVVGLGLVGFIIYAQNEQMAFWGLCGTGLLLGITLVLPIGGADMPVVICLLNSYAGLAAAATGFALKNNVLIICGALDGGSGFLLGVMMSKAMNRSFANVLFGAFGKVDEAQKKALASGPAPNEGSIDDAVEILGSARKVIVIPGYGLAVSQAQHAVKDLANALQHKGVDVKYAIHPVAGRMPGHMNVLLAEAQVPYEQLFDLDQINDEFASTDVALVVGANDVVNTAAREDPKSSIYGMPVFNVDLAKSCIVLKRTLNPGFAGIENGLFIKPNTMLVLGDAKKTLLSFVQGLKDSGH